MSKSRVRLIFQNEESDEFWHDLKLIGLDALPVQLDPVESGISM
jgi:hypothetical protein